MFDSMQSAASGKPTVDWPVVRRLRLVDLLPDDELSWADRRLTELRAEAPCAATLAELEDFDPAELAAGQRVTLLQLWERHACWLAARQQQAIVDVAGPAPVSRADDDWAELDVAAALSLSPIGASRRVEVARQLTGRLRATGTMLASGGISFWYALSLVEAVADLDDARAVAVETAVLDGAELLSISRFRARLRRAVINAAPATADERHAAASRERRVVLSPQPDGMAWLSAFRTAPEAIAAYRQLSEVARVAGGAVGAAGADAAGAGDADPAVQHQSADARRADAFLAAVLARAPDDGVGAPALATLVMVTIDSATLLGLAEHPGHLARLRRHPARPSRSAGR